jgi:hypothetical protein
MEPTAPPMPNAARISACSAGPPPAWVLDHERHEHLERPMIRAISSDAYVSVPSAHGVGTMYVGPGAHQPMRRRAGSVTIEI